MLWHDLAAYVFHCTVGEAKERCDSAEFTRWIAYFRLKPFGADLQNMLMGQVCATLANCHRGQNQKPFCASDFMYAFAKPPKPPQTLEQMKAVWASIRKAERGLR